VVTPPEVKSAVPPPASDQIIVRMDREKRWYINQTAFPRPEFGAQLAKALVNREAKVIFFAADGELPFGEVAEFLDACRDHGAQNLGIVFEDIGATPAAASAVGITR
jgi:biopolymer transport protein ExbD